MKFVNMVEDGITKVILDLEAVTVPAFKLESRDTVCVFEGTHDFDFTIVNEFLSSQNEHTLSYIARTLIDMRRCIVNSGYNDHAADECVGELKLSMYELVDNLPMSPTGNLFKDLYNFSAKYTTPDKVDSGYFNFVVMDDRQMLVAASLLSALCVMVIHNFKTHFTDVSEPLQILYPVFEETIRNSDVDGAMEFVERNRDLVSNMHDDPASWVIEGIYINDCILRKHKLSLPIDANIIENLAQRILSSKTYFSNRRMKEMKGINEAEEQQRNDRAKSTINNTILIDTALIAALIVTRAALSRGNTYLSDNACIAYCNEIIKDVNKVIMELNNRSSALSQRIILSCAFSEIGNDISVISEIVNAVCTEINIYVNQGIDEKFDGYDEINNSTKLFFIRGKFYLPPDLIINAIVDIISATSILSSNSLESYIPYNTLCERLQAFAMIVPKLNPEAGPAVTALIQSSSEINIGCLVSAIDSQNHI